jgi:hypothetical protein
LIDGAVLILLGSQSGQKWGFFYPMSSAREWLGE